MRTDFEFNNVLGGTYTDGNLCFTADGLSLLSAVGNRVAVYDLAQNRNVALPFEVNRNIVMMDLSKEEDLLAVADEMSQVTFIHFPSATKLECFRLTGSKVLEPPKALKISPDGSCIAAAVKDCIEVWTTPQPRVRQFKSVARLSCLQLTHSPATSIHWFPGSRHLAVGYEDFVVRIMPRNIPYVRNARKMALRQPVYALPSARAPIKGVFALDEKETDIFYLAVNGDVRRCTLRYRKRTDMQVYDQEDRLNRTNILDYNLHHWCTGPLINLPGMADEKLGGIFGADFNRPAGLLAVGYRRGKVALIAVAAPRPSAGAKKLGPPMEMSILHQLDVSAQSISCTILNGGGNWLAVASRKLGQIVVWDWRAEAYVLRQQAHQAADTLCVAYSPDGSVVATGGEDGKVKGWKGAHSYCFITFTEHTAAVTDVKFNATNSLFSASLDGTVRAYDMTRYRHYRVFTTPTPVQFSCLALDSSGEIVAAACLDAFEAYVWSAKTGRILEVLNGHEGPISRLSFSPVANVLVTSSWDKTLKIWPMFIGDQRTKESVETIGLMNCVVVVCFNNAGTELAAVTLGGIIDFYDTADMSDVKQLKGGIDVSRDIHGGYMLEEITKQQTQDAGRYVESAVYSANDAALLVGGYTKWVCLYDTVHRLLLRRWAVSCNLSLDGIRTVFDWRAQTEAGNRHLLEVTDNIDPDGLPIELPGAERGKPGAVGKRAARPVARTKYVTFAPSGREWAAATTAGLLIYSLDGPAASFRPVKLEYNLTPQAVYRTLAAQQYGLALQQALMLNDPMVLRAVVNGVPPSHLELVAGQVAPAHLPQLLEVLAAELPVSPHLEFYLQWTLQLQLHHSASIRKERLAPQLKELSRALTNKAVQLQAQGAENASALAHLRAVAALRARRKAARHLAKGSGPGSSALSSMGPAAPKGTPKRRRGLSKVQAGTLSSLKGAAKRRKVSPRSHAPKA